MEKPNHGWLHGVCEHRHVVHDKQCTLPTNRREHCPQWGETSTRCKFRNQALLKSLEAKK